MTGLAQRKQNQELDAKKERVRGEVQTELDALMKRSPALRFACVGTADGRLFAKAGSGSGDRFAAMTSSMLALGESFARDAFGGRCDYSVVSTPIGSIVIVRVPHQGSGYMLSVGSDGTEVLASTLRAALDSAGRIASIVALAAA